MVLYKQLSLWIRSPATCESVLTGQKFFEKVLDSSTSSTENLHQNNLMGHQGFDENFANEYLQEACPKQETDITKSQRTKYLPIAVNK